MPENEVEAIDIKKEQLMKIIQISQFYEKTVPENQTCNENRNSKDLFIKNRTRTVVTLVLFWFDFL